MVYPLLGNELIRCVFKAGINLWYFPGWRLGEAFYTTLVMAPSLAPMAFAFALAHKLFFKAKL